MSKELIAEQAKELVTQVLENKRGRMSNAEIQKLSPEEKKKWEKQYQDRVDRKAIKKTKDGKYSAMRIGNDSRK